MILPTAIREFRLEEKIRPGDYARSIRRRQAVADTRFKVVPPLVGRVDSSEPRS